MQKMDFNADWTFFKEGESPISITLPHDAMLLEQRREETPSGAASAFFEGGKYYYVKTFTVPEEWREKKALLYFEGVYQNAEVMLNGKKIAACAYGYSAFTAPMDDWEVGRENQIEVIADNTLTPNSRWYSGAGIYRPVSLWLGGAEHICFRGIKITTLSITPATVRVQTAYTGGEVSVEILDGSERIVSAVGSDVELTVPDARLWSDESPYLYACRVTLRVAGQPMDIVEEHFGIRMIAYSPKGLFINGKETLLRGGCIHHDNGILGARSIKEAEWRKVRILKDSGYNAIRSSHNPCSEELLKASDFYGMYVIDESWDMWFGHKNRFDYAGAFRKNWRFDLTSMVEKDFNHPSVLMYSIGNEVAEPATDAGYKLEQEMIGLLHSLDATRPVTGGFNIMIMGMAKSGNAIYDEKKVEEGKTPSRQSMNSSLIFNMATTMTGAAMDHMASLPMFDKQAAAAMDALDIAGYNYAAGRYPKEGRLHPERIIFGSETFAHAIVKNWRMVKRYPYLIGDFMWTAWDYLGEAGSGAWGYTPDAKGFEKPYPWLLADMGVLDILGNPNGELFLAQMAWGVEKGPKLAVRPVCFSGQTPARSAWRGTDSFPSWSWQGCDGKAAIVEVYADAAYAELLLNGQRIGKKKIKDYRASFKVKYVPGVLEAVAYSEAGQVLGKDRLLSANGKKAAAILPENSCVHAGEVIYCIVQIQGENGVTECNADRTLSVRVEGGELLGFGSANPRTEESFVSGTYTTYYGKAQAVIRAGRSGVMKITVQDGLYNTVKEFPVEV